MKTIDRIEQKLNQIDVRTINIEKHAIQTNGKVKLNEKQYDWLSKAFYVSLGVIVLCFGCVFGWMLKIGGQ